MADKENFKQFVATLQNKYSSLPLEYANFVAQGSQSDWEKAKNLYLKAIKEKYFISKKERKNKADLLEISFSDAEKISKYYKEESGKQRETFNKGKAKRISLGPKIKELENLISNLRETEITDNPLERMKNPLYSFERFLCEISKPEYTLTTYPTQIKSEYIPRSI